MCSTCHIWQADAATLDPHIQGTPWYMPDVQRGCCALPVPCSASCTLDPHLQTGCPRLPLSWCRNQLDIFYLPQTSICHIAYIFLCTFPSVSCNPLGGAALLLEFSCAHHQLHASACLLHTAAMLHPSSLQKANSRKLPTASCTRIHWHARLHELCTAYVHWEWAPFLAS